MYREADVISPSLMKFDNSVRRILSVAAVKSFLVQVLTRISDGTVNAKLLSEIQQLQTPLNEIPQIFYRESLNVGENFICAERDFVEIRWSHGRQF